MPTNVRKIFIVLQEAQPLTGNHVTLRVFGSNVQQLASFSQSTKLKMVNGATQTA